jgi:ubiquinone biosynthesis protein UbiJ
MFNGLSGLNLLLGGAVIERATLLANHVLGAEPVATDRLRAHAGRCIRLHFDGWPMRLPPLPATAFRITPAGLVEWCGADALPEADLRVSIDASNPALAFAQALTGERPKVEVAGDAAFAGDLNWLFDNLRWDVQDDLARLVGQAPAREIARLSGAVAAGMREAVRTLGGLVASTRK